MIIGTHLRTTGLVLFSLCGASSIASAQAKPAKPVLPSAVSKAFHHAYPAATIREWSREKEKGRTIYEVESQDGAMRRDLLYSSTGQTIEIEETIATADLPAAVRTAVEVSTPGAVITRAERVSRSTVVTYELSVKVAGKTRGLAFDAAGQPVKP